MEFIKNKLRPWLNYRRRVRRAVEDVKEMQRIEKRFPCLRDFENRYTNRLGRLEPIHREYINNVSDYGMAASLKACMVMKMFLDAYKPQRVLDTGSGFSSYITRTYARENPGVVAVSVDDNQMWLGKTREYLEKYQLNADHLYFWEDFKKDPGEPFDFIFHDMGSMQTRQDELLFVLGLVKKPHGIVLLDDLHKNEYGPYVQKLADEGRFTYYPLKLYTHDEANRWNGIAVDVK